MASNAANNSSSSSSSSNDDNHDMVLENSSSTTTTLTPEEIAAQNASKLSLLAQYVFEYSCSNDISPNKDELKTKILAEIERSRMYKLKNIY